MPAARYCKKGQGRRRAQAGVALITVLMVFAIGSIIVSKILLQRSVDAQRISSMVARTQAHFYARAGEDLAILGLRAADSLDDRPNYKNADTLEEAWASAISYEVDGFGQVAVQIIDLNRYYNINNMLEPDGQINLEELERFRNLLVELDISAELADNVADWLDSDDSELGYNSESSHYLSQQLSYRAANRIMYDIRELYQVAGFDREVFERLEPHIAAVPVADVIRLNYNTATRYALSTVETKSTSNPNEYRTIGLNGANSILDERPYELASEVSSRAGLRDIVTDSRPPESKVKSGNQGVNQTPNRSRLRQSVLSDYFQINTRANYGGQVAYLTTIVQQVGAGDAARFIVLWRDESDNSARFVPQY